VGVGTAPFGTTALGDMAGNRSHTLTVAQLPGHTHTVPAASGTATSNRLTGLAPAKGGRYGSCGAAMAPTGVTGAGQPVDHTPPYLGLHYIICLYGIYLSRP
jgi:microcystin-dependent protein